MHATHWKQKLLVPSQLKATLVPEKKEHKKKITWFLTTILNSNHGIWLDVLNDHVVTYFCQGSTSTQVYNPGRATFDCNV